MNPAMAAIMPITVLIPRQRRMMAKMSPAFLQGGVFYRAAIWFKCNAASVGGRAADEDPDPENNWRYKNGVPILQDDGNGISAYSSSRASKAVVRKGIDVGERNGTIWNYRLGKRMGWQVRDLFWRKPSMLRPFSSIGKIWWTG